MNCSEATEVVDNDDCVHVPKPKPILSEIEESIAFELALTSENTQIIRKSPITIDDVIDALKVCFLNSLNNFICNLHNHVCFNIFLLYVSCIYFVIDTSKYNPSLSDVFC